MMEVSQFTVYQICWLTGDYTQKQNILEDDVEVVGAGGYFHKCIWFHCVSFQSEKLTYQQSVDRFCVAKIWMEMEIYFFLDWKCKYNILNQDHKKKWQWNPSNWSLF